MRSEHFRVDVVPRLCDDRRAVEDGGPELGRCGARVLVLFLYSPEGVGKGGLLLELVNRSPLHRSVQPSFIAQRTKLVVVFLGNFSIWPALRSVWRRWMMRRIQCGRWTAMVGLGSKYGECVVRFFVRLTVQGGVLSTSPSPCIL